jgi:hypothetical protein
VGRIGVKHIDRLSRADALRRHNVSSNNHKLQLKISALAAYGEVCQCCGEAWPIFLTIDHMTESGAKHRRDTNTRGGHNFYLWLKQHAYPTGFQVLCFNCNFAKHVKKICPHQSTSGRDSGCTQS